MILVFQVRELKKLHSILISSLNLGEVFQVRELKKLHSILISSLNLGDISNSDITTFVLPRNIHKRL